VLDEDEVLARELGRLGGIGGKLVARLLATKQRAGEQAADRAVE
jgi:hypothetical protein